MKFIESTHTYLNKENVPYLSVTSILKKLEPVKNWDAIAEAYAKKNNMTLQEVQAKWQKEKDDSIVRGKKYHAAEEASILGLTFAAVMKNEVEVGIPIYGSQIINGEKKSDSLQLTEGVYPELMLWLDEAKLAGQADRVEIVGNRINIIDYKTNKKIDLTSWKDRYGKTEKLSYPCNHMDNCNFSIYSLQLNFYAYMIKQHNPKLRLGKMTIKHVKFSVDGEVEKVIDISVPNRQKEVKDIIDFLSNPTKPKTFSFK